MNSGCAALSFATWEVTRRTGIAPTKEQVEASPCSLRELKFGATRTCEGIRGDSEADQLETCGFPSRLVSVHSVIEKAPASGITASWLETATENGCSLSGCTRPSLPWPHGFLSGPTCPLQ